jgi:hypothetical protein
VTPDELHEIVQLIGGLSTEMQAGFEKTHRELAAVRDRLDHIEARLDKQGGLLQSGSRWVNRLNQWSERMDHPALKHTESLRDHESRIDRLEHPKQ